MTHTIQITVNAFDPHNPIDQNLLAQALQPAIERSGKTYIIGTR